MDEQKLNNKEYAKIRELVATSNQKGLRALLGFPSRKSNSSRDGDSKLEILPGTPKASALVECLGNKISGNKGGECNLDVDDILQALLMIDPMYSTPWKALASFALALDTDAVPVVSLLQCVSSIEDFLLKAKFPFDHSSSDEDEKLGIRDIMAQFVLSLSKNLVLAPNVEYDSKQLDGAHDKTRAMVVTQLGTQLLHTIFSVCKGWSSDLFNVVVSNALFQRPAPNKVKNGLKLAQQSILLLTCAQTENIGLILLDLLCDKFIKISPAEDVATIISIAVEIAHTLDSTPSIADGEPFKNVMELWRKICFVGLYQTAIQYHEQCYLQSENCLKEGIKKWNVATLRIWILEIIDASTVPLCEGTRSDDGTFDDTLSTHSAGDEFLISDWFAVNLVSLCTGIFIEEDNASNLGLLERTIRPDLPDNSLSDHECKSILDFVFGKDIIAGDSELVWDFVSEYENISLLNKRGIKIYYRKRGTFYSERGCDKSKFKWLSRCGAKIFQSLLENCHEPHGLTAKYKSSALSRAMRLVNMADHILTNCPEDLLPLASTFAKIVKTVTYFEMPECRAILEDKINEALLKPSRLQNSHFCTLRLIVYSELKRNDINSRADKWFGIIERVIPFHHENYLDLVRSILPAGGSGILKISEKLFAPLYSSWGAHEYENANNEERPEPEMQERIIGGVRGLLELVRRRGWGESEGKAWVILSDLMVNDEPPVPSECREELFRTLISFVSDGSLDFMVADRILRATATRMSSFFVDYEVESRILATSKQMEEIRSLHRLMTILLQYLATDEYSGYRQILLAQGREVFLRAVLSYKKGQLVGNQYHHDISKKYFSIGIRESTAFIPCWFLFLKINLYLLDHTMSDGSKMETFGHLENSSMDHQICLELLVGKITELERNDLLVDGAADQDDILFIPFWRFESPSHINTELKEKFPCLDLLLEFLFLVPLPARESLDLDDPLSWKIVTASGFLIRRKNTSTKKAESALIIETMKKTAEPLLSASSFLLRGAIDIDCGLSALDDLLPPVVSYCRALHLTLEDNSVPDCERITGCLWNLYQAAASEKACVKIIKYLESHVSENHTASTRRDDDFFSLLSIHTESEIDETIRKLRFSCLQPFLSSLSHLSSLSPEEINDLSLSRSQVGGILGALVTDLRVGLDGKSGGIPRKLYITYCMCIEECGSLLFHKSEVPFDFSVFHLFRDVTTTLSEILVSVPLRDAVLFRTTFILAVAIFPSMCREQLRGCCNGSNDFDSDDPRPEGVGQMLRDDTALFDEVLDDCTDILIRWAALRDPCSIPWLDIAGADHSDKKSDTTHSQKDERGMSNNYDSEPEVDWQIPRFVHVPSPPRNRRQSDTRPRKESRKIRLYTKEVWSWALSCSLLGLEQNWLDSERTIQVEKPGPHAQVSLKEWKEFFVNRTTGWRDIFFGDRLMELQKSLLQINRFFRSSQGLQHLRGKHIVLDMMAMNLPSAPRLRFCCLLECVARVLILSIKQMCLFLSEEIRDALQDLSVFESASCLSAWLALEEDPENDFSVGVFKWLAIASRKSPPDEVFSTKKREDKAELFERVSMVSREVHNLYLELKELQTVLQKRGVDASVAGELLQSFSNGSSRNIASEMLRRSEVKLHVLEQVIPSEFKAKSLPDFPSSSEMESLERKRAPSERSKQAKPKKRKVQRNSVRNRNKVVDIFMNLDRGSDSPRRNNTKDAYADLEDFLVEG